MTTDIPHTALHLKSRQEFLEWIRQEIGRYTGLTCGELDFNLSVHALGMSSVHVVRLAGEVEERLQIDVDPTAFYDSESIDTLCEKLWSSHQHRVHRNQDKLCVTASIRPDEIRRRPLLPTGYATPRTDWEQRLCALWRDVLGIDQVGIHDRFQALGGDDRAANEICERLWDIGIPKSMHPLAIQSQTVAKLCQEIEKALGTVVARPTDWRLEDDTVLPDDIRLPLDESARRDKPMTRVLLTGATGYLGAFLLHELMAQTHASVVCLVRAADEHEGLQRVLANLRAYQLGTEDIRARLSVIVGDLSAPWLGLDRRAFSALATEIDAIFHGAATVNFLSSYQRLKASNVDATRTLLRLACSDPPRPIPFHYISTLGVAMSASYGREASIPEDIPLRYGDDLPNGYEQSKFVSDRMVWLAFQERGIPGAIYRPPLVSGLSGGRYHKLDEFLPRILKGCLQLGAFPGLDSLLEIAPIDFVSKAIVHIARQPENLNKAYFVVHPESRRIADLIAWYQRSGFPVRSLPWDVWKEELLGLEPTRRQQNALAPFIDLLRTLSPLQACFPNVDSQQFHRATRDLAFKPPAVLDLLARYTRYFIESGDYDDVPGLPSAFLQVSCESKPRFETVGATGS